MNSVSSRRAHDSPEVFHEVMFAAMPDHDCLPCPGFLASPILTLVLPLCCGSSLGSSPPASSL
eukprot:11626510-Heterocapsa_arctica.AAC.1